MDARTAFVDEAGTDIGLELTRQLAHAGYAVTAKVGPEDSLTPLVENTKKITRCSDLLKNVQFDLVVANTQPPSSLDDLSRILCSLNAVRPHINGPVLGFSSYSASIEMGQSDDLPTDTIRAAFAMGLQDFRQEKGAIVVTMEGESELDQRVASLIRHLPDMKSGNFYAFDGTELKW